MSRLTHSTCIKDFISCTCPALFQDTAVNKRAKHVPWQVEKSQVNLFCVQLVKFRFMSKKGREMGLSCKYATKHFRDGGSHREMRSVPAFKKLTVV